MNILVIEDELKTARSLIRLISSVRPDTKIDGPLQRVSAAVNYLSAHPSPDLIFMDIQLADGLSFEIFEKVKIDVPVIFCTAFDEYALQAFKANGVDYILKPFSEDSIKAAFTKLEKIGNLTGTNAIPASLITQLLQINQPKAEKQSFLVFKNGKYTTVPVPDIAYIFVRNEQTTLVTFQGEMFMIDQSLEETANQLDHKSFFKLNRQYLIAFKAIKEVEHYFARKLLVKLTIQTKEKLLVGKDKTTAFLKWLEER
ncbi:LytR/AlgR family response regulator transcription factor [Mucilaginibacter sp. KACC 22063]|uniref:LytR/AlgR family response regulator transcription factor n=1 Tax=Mucilaginibacter sp. KACC 22063 TaxID=3025666 RepID=UPI0023650EA3|nr:LytTR family DNA-binding domain-containing protein [Mucilaginibacter sp. KACC 22063]WDF57264.1 LytTR family DNA-binding domain-containing protein [Mucilaginibacter sp. KACC 22063]